MEEETNIIDISTLKVDDLLERAEASFSEMSYEKAKAFYQEAYTKCPDNEDLLCSYANFLTTVGEITLARSLLRKSLEMNIEKSCNYKKFVQMAELVDGKLSVQLYEKAIEILIKLYNPIIDNDPIQNEIKRDLALSYSALAEIYQTDLLQFKESEGFCKKNIEEALRIDNKCLDAYLQYANFYLNKDDIDEAKKWLDLLMVEFRKEEDSDDEELLGNKEEEKIEEEKKNYEKNDKSANFFDFYPISFKLSISKVLIEVEDFDSAIEILESYNDEDNENIEGLYLLAFTNFKARNYNRCQEVMLDLSKKDMSVDDEIRVAFVELQEELKKVDIGQGNDKDNGDDEWMDVE